MCLYLSVSALRVSGSLVHHQEQLYKPLCTTARRMVPAYTNSDIQNQNVAPDDGLKSPKHVEHLMINKDTL